MAQRPMSPCTLMARTMPAMTVGKAAGLPEALFIESGHRRLTPVSVQSDQLLCLPEPLMPAGGGRRAGGRGCRTPAIVSALAACHVHQLAGRSHAGRRQGGVGEGCSPEKGFSWSRAAKPWRAATSSMICITRRFWSICVVTCAKERDYKG